MILAIDPGSEKTGTAVLGTDGSLVCRQIIPTGDLSCHLREMYKKYAFTHIVMGMVRTTVIFSPLPKNGYAKKHRM